MKAKARCIRKTERNFSAMKIGIIGNMNNMYFSLARYLADEGYDCDLLIFDSEQAHFHPTADTFGSHSTLAIKRLSWGDPAQFLTKQKQAATDLQPYDFLIGSGTAPAFAYAAGRVLDLFIPYGEDLYIFPFPHLVHPVRQLPYLVLARHQLRGIRQARHLLSDKTNPGFDRIFEKIKYKGGRIVSPPPLLYYKEYETALAQQQNDNPHSAALQALRNNHELLVLQHGRQFWKPHADRWTQKGNDQLIKGYALFLAKNPSCKAKLLLFEYGRDVAHTKKLIDDLKLNTQVVWFSKTERKNLMAFIQTSDAVVGELKHAWNTYCVMMETLAMGKPLIHHRNDAYLAGAYPALYPMLQASSAEDVCRALKTVWQNEKAVRKMGEEGKEWFDEYCVRKPLQHIIRLIDEKKKGLHG